MTRLTDALPETGDGDPTLATLGDTTRELPTAQPGPAAVTVYVVNGTRTSAGPGPGPLSLPPAEANALIRQRFAVPGNRAPGAADPEPVTKAVQRPA